VRGKRKKGKGSHPKGRRKGRHYAVLTFHFEGPRPINRGKNGGSPRDGLVKEKGGCFPGRKFMEEQGKKSSKGPYKKGK